MKITNEFVVQIPIDQAWKVLTDLEGIAPCMPGAQLTGVDGDVYRGKVKVKVGPVISEFAGTAQFTAKDDTAYRAVIDAKGRDARSAGNAAAVVSASLTAQSSASTKVSVDTDLKISGKLAQFGSGMIKEVSSKLLAQFVANLESKLAADTAAPAAAVSTAGQSTAGQSVSGPSAPDQSAPAVVPDPSAGEVAPSAGRLETAEGTPEPVAPLRTPGAELAAVVPGGDLSVAPSGGPSQPPAGPAAADAPAPAADSGAPAPAASAAPAAPPVAGTSTDRALHSAEPEAIDLLAVAGGSIYKRAVPVAIGAVAVVAVIVWFVARG